MNSSNSKTATNWYRVSIRTVGFTMLSVCLLLAIYTQGASSPLASHTTLVLAFAIPGGSWGYDITQTSRGAAIGLIATAIIGTVTLSALVLLNEVDRLFF